MKILFLCRGNVGRSQMASALFNKYTGLKTLSAGTKVLDKEGQKLKEISLAEPVIRFMKEEGIDLSENPRKQITEEMMRDFNKIINMSEPEKTPDYIKNNPKTIHWEIKDPKEQNDEFYKNTIRLLKEKIKSFIEENNL